MYSVITHTYIFKFFYISLKNSGTTKLREFGILAFSSSGTFVYELILTKISMNANIDKTQSFYDMKYYFRGH